MLTRSELAAIMPNSGASAALYVEPLNDSADEFDIDNPDRLAAWLATIAVESRELTRTSELLHYSSAGRIADVWPARFTASSAAPYVGQPEKLANAVYANRMGNGPIESGDGWRHRGVGGMMITGRDNHKAAAAHFKMALDEFPNWARTPVGAMRSAGWYWWTRALNVLADQGQFRLICRKVQGGNLGLSQRLAYHERARSILGC